MARIQRQMQSLTDHLATLGLDPLLDAPVPLEHRGQLPTPCRDALQRLLAADGSSEGYFCLYGIPGDQSHFQLSTIGDL